MKQQENTSFKELDDYKDESKKNIAHYKHNTNLQDAAKEFLKQTIDARYIYNFFWCGIPIIQIGQEIQAMQEIIWEIKPDCIIETGVAWGGSLMFSASMLCILEACNLIEDGFVIGIDIDIRPHNKKNILAHPLSKKIRLLEGSSIDPGIVNQVKSLISTKKKILVCLDSHHTHAHVLNELRAYSPLVSVGSYCMVGDTAIEDNGYDLKIERPWGKGNSPKTAVWAFLQENTDFVIDEQLAAKLVLTGSPDGYLKRVK